VPVYQYACTECGHELEVRQSFTDEPLSECPTCDGRLRKVLSAVGVVFKGSGFYRTDSRKDAGGGADAAKVAEGTSSGGSGNGADSKPGSSANGSGTSGSSGNGSSGQGSIGKGSSGQGSGAGPTSTKTSSAAAAS
jgi:putative FmdB family regulatory protein